MDCPPSGSIVWLMVTSSKRTCATSCVPQDCCCKSPCPHALQKTFKHLQQSDSVSCGGVTVPFPGSWCTQGFVCVLQASLVGMRIDFQRHHIAPTALLLHLLYYWMWGVLSFFGGLQHPLGDCSALVVILVLSQEKMSACPSTPPSCC